PAPQYAQARPHQTQNQKTQEARRVVTAKVSPPRRQSASGWLEHAVMPAVLPGLLVVALIVNIWYDLRHRFALFVDLIGVGTALLCSFLKDLFSFEEQQR